ncbi:MAG: [FeFe] hydrogenase H-cluster radical SAM maturase HydE [Lachnospiraceae bacterium]|nr:[FeFe] hydrogenase H-cluster radical SAM maturase HydE [Lachnospiraceae bacterium]
MLEEIVDRLEAGGGLGKDELTALLLSDDCAGIDYLKSRARYAADCIYGKNIYIRGLIEFTSYCRNNCYYCGIRCGNAKAQRYRLTQEQTVECCESGYVLGFRTFVLQGGEDEFFTEKRICSIVYGIKSKFPDCAVTLSVGEKSRSNYQAYFDAGADRYLLRHETANQEHYERLHPKELRLENRKKCLYDLKEIGYQVGAGFMVGSPFQTFDAIYEDLQFIRELEPHMVGIGPFIPHKDTPFANARAGTLEMTLRLLSIIRLMHPRILLPATTALGTIHPMGRELGIRAGANVVMPNLSPVEVREKYQLYNNKICMGDEAAESLQSLRNRMAEIGYQIVIDRGDFRRE